VIGTHRADLKLASRCSAGCRDLAAAMGFLPRRLAGRLLLRPDRQGLVRAVLHAAGIVMVKTAPCPAPQAADIRPPCVSMIERLIDRPIPIPSGLVV